VSGCLGNRGLVRLGVIETMRGNSDGTVGLGGSCDDDATGVDDGGVILGKGGMSHRRGMRSSEDGTVFLIGGNGISSGVGDLFHGAGITGVASLCGGDRVSDWGNGMSMGSSMFMGGGSYCSIDEYCCRCNPQGIKGSGGVMTRRGGDEVRGSSSSGGLGGASIGANGDGSTMGGDSTLGTTGGKGTTSLGRDDDGWINDRITGMGPTWGGGAVARTDGSGSGIMMVDPPVLEGLGLGMNTGDGDLLLIIILRPLSNVWSPSRNV